MTDKELKAIKNHPRWWPRDVRTALGLEGCGYKFNQDAVPQSVQAFNKIYGTHCTMEDLLRLINLK